MLVSVWLAVGTTLHCKQGCAWCLARDPSKPLVLQCPPIDKCTDFTDALTDPPCCCKKCTAPYVPMCPDLSKSCNEAGGSGCGCKCPPSEPPLEWQCWGGRKARCYRQLALGAYDFYSVCCMLTFKGYASHTLLHYGCYLRRSGGRQHMLCNK